MVAHLEILGFIQAASYGTRRRISLTIKGLRKQAFLLCRSGSRFNIFFAQ